MKTAPLGDVAEFINGVAFKPQDWHDSGLPIIRIQNLTDPDKPINLTTRRVDDKYKVRRGDILVSWSATLGVFTWERTDEALVNQHIFRVVPDTSLVTPGYLRHVLQGALVSMERHLHGATMQHVNRGEFLATVIPLPPLDEQRRIAAVLNHADALHTHRRQVLAYLSTLSASVFVEQFRNVRARAVFSELGVDFTSGKNVVGSEIDAHTTNRVIKVSAISSGRFKPDEIKPMPGDYRPPNSHQIKLGDILFGRASGSLDLLGATAVVDEACDNLYLPDKVWRLEVTPGGPVIPEFVLASIFRAGGVRRC